MNISEYSLHNVGTKHIGTIPLTESVPTVKILFYMYNVHPALPCIPLTLPFEDPAI